MYVYIYIYIYTHINILYMYIYIYIHTETRIYTHNTYAVTNDAHLNEYTRRSHLASPPKEDPKMGIAGSASTWIALWMDISEGRRLPGFGSCGGHPVSELQ